MNGCEAAAELRRLGPPPDVLASLWGLRGHEEPMRSGGHLFDVKLPKPMRMGELMGKPVSAGSTSAKRA